MSDSELHVTYHSDKCLLEIQELKSMQTMNKK